MLGRKNSRTSALIVTVFGIVVMLYGFRLYYDHGLQSPKGLTDFNDIGDYQINPDTILLELNDGNMDVFSPVSLTPVASTPFPVSSHAWTQSDYIKTANSLHQFVWGEAVDDWYVYKLAFYRSCQDNPTGFGSADITYYKYDKQLGFYTVHELIVYPHSGIVSWGGGNGFARPLFGWRNINLNRLRTNADSALQFAEKNGGKEFRVKVKNTCDMTLILNPNSDHGGSWAVYYHTEDGLSTFEIKVNPY